MSTVELNSECQSSRSFALESNWTRSRYLNSCFTSALLSSEANAIVASLDYSGLASGELYSACG